MSRYSTEVKDLRYNAASQCFEALVVLYEGPDVVKYPTSLSLPIQSDFSSVAQKLVAEAKRQRKQRGSSLVSRTASGQHKLGHLGDLARQFGAALNLGKSQQAA